MTASGVGGGVNHGTGRTWTQVLFSLGKGNGDCFFFGFFSFFFPRPRSGLDTGEPEKERNLNLSTWLSSRIPTPLSSSSVLQTIDLGRGEVVSIHLSSLTLQNLCLSSLVGPRLGFMPSARIPFTPFWLGLYATPTPDSLFVKNTWYPILLTAPASACVLRSDRQWSYAQII